MAEIKQKSVQLPPFLGRVLPAWVSPMWLEARRWRQVVRNQPVLIICRNRLITYLQALPWDVRAKDNKMQEKLEPDIRYYKDHVMANFDTDMDLMWQDVLDLPVGGNIELVRWPEGSAAEAEIDGEIIKPTQPAPLGHVDRLVHIDGATVAPTYDATFPLMQRIQGGMSQPIFFKKHEVGRIMLSPRPEIMVKGYGMPPPQIAFLAISLLYRGDQYYANLLLDTPEAGVLDLLDMEKGSAEEWVGSYRDLMSGIDPFKIGVLYEHQTAAKWIPFGRPPTEMMFDTTTMKYARITAASYWLTLKDIGLEPGSEAMGAAVRRQRETRSTGFGMIREMTKNFINKQVLPPYLEFDYIEIDDEALTNKGRARLTNAQAMKTMVEAKLITSAEGQEQMKKDGLLTVEVDAPKEEPEPPAGGPPLAPPPGGAPSPADAAAADAEKVPISQGGRGDVGVQKAELGDPAISAGARRRAAVDKLARVVEQAFGAMQARMGEPQLRKLVKQAARIQFPLASKALHSLPAELREEWAVERSLSWRGEPSIFDAEPLIQRANGDIEDEFDSVLGNDLWWELSESVADEMAPSFTEAFGQGATVAATEMARYLYEEGLLPSPNPIGLDFTLKNPETLTYLETEAANLVRHVNDGTKAFLRRAVLSGVDAGLSSDEIALRIQEGQGLARILKETGFVDDVARVAREQITGMLSSRVKSIVNTEIARAETEGRRQQWQKTGLTKKRWAHTGGDIPCPFCQANIERGLIGMDEEFDSVFGDETVQGPPAHPGVDHCHLEFDEAELIKLAGDPQKFALWDGR